MARDGSGNFSAGTITAALNGNASSATTVTTNANLTGNVTSSGNTTTIVTGAITDSMIAAATISDAKLATISTAGKVSNSATTATSTAGNNTIVARDGSGGFLAAGITATSINVSSYQLASTGFNNQTGATYTIAATDNGKIVTGSVATTFTLPAAAIGFSVTIIQIGTGAITIVASGSDTLNSFGKSSFVTAGQWAAVDVVCTATNKWVLFGNLA